jgi:hypothetical protein
VFSWVFTVSEWWGNSVPRWKAKNITLYSEACVKLYLFMAWCLLIGIALLLHLIIRPLPIERIATASCSAYDMYHFVHVTFSICYCRFLVCAIFWGFRIYIQGQTLITKFTIHFHKILGHYTICLAISLDLVLLHCHFNTGYIRAACFQYGAKCK